MQASSIAHAVFVQDDAQYAKAVATNVELTPGDAPPAYLPAAAPSSAMTSAPPAFAAAPPVRAPSLSDADALGAFLKAIKLEKFSSALAEQDIDVDTPCELTAEELKEVGMTIGAVMKVQKAAGKWAGVSMV